MLTAISLVLAITFLVAFIWAVKSGQYEDDFSPSLRILYEEKIKKEESKIKTKNKKQ